MSWPDATATHGIGAAYGRTALPAPAGRVSLEYSGNSVTTVSTPRLQSLLAYVVLHGHTPLARAHLAYLFWPDSSEAQARTNLRHQLHLLRQALPVADQLFDADTQTLRLRPGAPVQIDVTEFVSDTAPGASSRQLQAAVALYQGDLLPSCYDEWLLPFREQLRQRFGAALEQLIRLLEAACAYEPALGYAQRLRQHDPLHEASYRHLMRLYALSGDQAGVRRSYEECAAVLRRELDVEPSAATRQAYKRLLRGMTLSAQTHNLPATLTPFVGRAEELAQVTKLLAEPTCRLLTLTGAGGVGKTRLALQAAQGLIQSFADGVCFVPLASLSASQLLVATVADALGFPFHGAQAPEAQLLGYLREKELLLVLDGYEHLLPHQHDAPEQSQATGDSLLGAILAAAPGIKLLVTSRLRLQLYGEWIYAIEGLAVPRADSSEELETYSAVQLFLLCARRARLDFVLPTTQRSDLARLCRLLAGLPLGIELAATWAGQLSIAEIAQELVQNLDLPHSAFTLLGRHRNLRTVFDYSWNLLSAAEQGAFRRLSVLRGSFRRETATHVAGADLRLLAALVDVSLLRRDQAGGYLIHELLRQYAGEQLAALPGEREATLDQHGRYFMGLLRVREAQLKSREHEQAHAALLAQIDDIRLACQRAIAQLWADELGQAARSLWLLYDFQEWYHEAEALFRQAAEALAGEQPGEASESARQRRVALGKMLALQGWFSLRLGKFAPARALHAQSAALLRSLGAHAALADTLQTFSMVAWVEGSYNEAQLILDECLGLLREQDAPWDMALCLCCMGNVAHLQGRHAEAMPLLQEALAGFRALGDARIAALTLSYLGPVAYELGLYDDARRWLSESVVYSRAMSHRWILVLGLNQLGALLAMGDRAVWPEARHLHEESLAIASELGDYHEIAVGRNHLGYLSCAMGEHDVARELFAAALHAAQKVRATPLALDALVGMATVLLQQPAELAAISALWARQRAAEILALVRQYAAASPPLPHGEQGAGGES